jgi:hypothetical protein
MAVAVDIGPNDTQKAGNRESVFGIGLLCRFPIAESRFPNGNPALQNSPSALIITGPEPLHSKREQAHLFI